MRALNFASRGRQHDLFLSQPEEHLPGALELRKFTEDNIDSISHSTIGVLFEPIIFGVYIADGYEAEQLPSSRFRPPRINQAPSEYRQLHLAHRSFHAEHKSIVRIAWIVHAILVDDQTIDQTTGLKQRVPIPSVAGWVRSFDLQDCTNSTFADACQQSFEARSGGPIS